MPMQLIEPKNVRMIAIRNCTSCNHQRRDRDGKTWCRRTKDQSRPWGDDVDMKFTTCDGFKHC